MFSWEELYIKRWKGVGFLGSGIIFKEGANVKGINTAATIWCAATVGVLCGVGQHWYAIIAACLILVGNMILRPMAKKIGTLPIFDETGHLYQIKVIGMKKEEFAIRLEFMKENNHSSFYLTNLKSEDVQGNRVEVEAIYYCTGNRRDDLAEKIACNIGTKQGVESVGWELH